MRYYMTCMILIGLLFVSLAAHLSASEKTAESKGKVNFEKEIAPLIVEHCIRCHNPGNEKGELSLASIQALTEKGFLTPGKPSESYLLDVLHVDSKTGKAEMPKDGKPLSSEEILLFTRWVAQGAARPAQLKLQEKSKTNLSWWSLQPLAHNEPPEIKGAPKLWQKNPVDQFVYAKLQEKN
jgi:hypothetical protein